MNPMAGRGFGGRGFFGRGRGRGMGRGFGFWATGLPGWARAGWAPAWGAAPEAAAYASTLPPERELEVLRSQSEYFGSALAEIRKRIEELEAAAEKK
jgi:hypothetical protein